MALVMDHELDTVRELEETLDALDELEEWFIVGSTRSIRNVMRNLREEGEDCDLWYAYTSSLEAGEGYLAAAGYPVVLGTYHGGPGYIYAIVIHEQFVADDSSDDYGHEECYGYSEDDDSYESRRRRRRCGGKQSRVKIGNIYIGDGQNRQAEALETLAAGIKVVGAATAAAVPLCGCTIM